MSYYDDLSVGSSHDHADSGSESDTCSEDDDREWLLATAGCGRNSSGSEAPKLFTNLSNGLWSRCILHLDVDCFYCQCEEIDRNLRTNKVIRPLAIGQKHIVVTANYAAREYGVQKLQSREAAYAACPHLWIVEGSDLTRYRWHSRAIYEAFRTALQDVSRDLCIHSGAGNWKIPAKKGCMDEMMADLTLVVEEIIIQDEQKEIKQPSQETDHSRKRSRYDKEQARFVFGEDAPSSMAILVEDQTGEQSIVCFQPSIGEGTSALDAQETSLPSSRRNIHNNCGASCQDRYDCQRRLEIAADLTERVCQYIRQRTGFHTTAGVSVSPLLAKLASGLNKPKSVNLLFPWRSSQILYPMPLRKMHKIGHSTMKALEKEMTATDDVLLPKSKISKLANDEREKKKMRTVRDLLEMPRSSIQRAIQGMAAFQAETSCEEQCDLLIRHCRGLDTSEVIDDEGQLPKTLSVENSFRRGTIQNIDSVNQALEDLCRRLPLLLRDRASWALDPQKAYPTTIRLTIRMVDPQLAVLKKRRPYLTKSKQSPIDGKRCFVQETDLQAQASAIRRHTKPLLQQLLPPVVNITRMNIAMTNFQDVSLSQAVATDPRRRDGQFTLAESLDRTRSSAPTQAKHSPPLSEDLDGQLKSNNHSVVMGGRHILPDRTSVRSDGNHILSKLNTRERKSFKSGRMKPTKIDHYFFKK